MDNRKKPIVILFVLLFIGLFCLTPIVLMGSSLPVPHGSQQGLTLTDIENTVLREIMNKGIDPERHRQKCLNRRLRVAAFKRWNQAVEQLRELISTPVLTADGFIDARVMGSLEQLNKSLVQDRSTIDSNLLALKKRLETDRVPRVIIQRLERLQHRFSTHAISIVTRLEQTGTLLEQTMELAPRQQRKQRGLIEASLTKLKTALKNEISNRRQLDILGSQTLPFTNAGSNYSSGSDTDQTNSQSDQFGGTSSSGSSSELLEEPVPEDTLNTNETTSYPVFTDLVTTLDANPKAIFEYVRDTIEPEFYYGLLKGARETLLQEKGNDFDQAALLIALFRTANIPAHYAVGRVTMSIEQLQEWTGTDNASSALKTVLDNGYAPNPVYQDGQLWAVSLNHCWVEVYVPYLDYRGLGDYPQGKDWISLSPAFKQVTRSGGLELWNEPNCDMSAWKADYLNLEPIEQNLISPLEFYRLRITDYLQSYYPGLSYNDIFPYNELVSEDLGLLPSSLPFPVDYILERFSSVTGDYLHLIGLTIGDVMAPSLTWTTPSYTVLGKRVTIQYDAASTSDLAAMQSAGSLYLTDPFLIEVVPVLMLNNEIIAQGLIPIGMALPDSMTVQITSPTVSYTLTDPLLSGTYQALSFSTGPVPDKDRTELNAQSRIGLIMAETALRYLDLAADSAHEIAEFCGVYTSPQTVSVSRCLTHLDVEMIDDIPVTLEWKSLDLDVELQPNQVVSRSADWQMEPLYQQLLGYEYSYLEEFTFSDTDWFGIPSISTVSAIRHAAFNGITIHQIDLSTMTLIDDLQLPQEIIDSIAESVLSGYSVIVPEQTITLEDWTGTGWLVINPNTGSIGAMIAGNLAGAYWQANFNTLFIWTNSEMPMYPMLGNMLNAWTAYFMEMFAWEPFNSAPYQAAILNRITLSGSNLAYQFEYDEGLDVYSDPNKPSYHMYWVKTRTPKNAEMFGYYLGFPPKPPEPPDPSLPFQELYEENMEYFIAKADYYKDPHAYTPPVGGNQHFMFTLGADPPPDPDFPDVPPARMRYNIKLLENVEEILPPGTYEFYPQDWFKSVGCNREDPEDATSDFIGVCPKDHHPRFVIFKISFTDVPAYFMPPGYGTSDYQQIKFKIDPARMITRTGQRIPVTFKEVRLIILDCNHNQVNTERDTDIFHLYGSDEYIYTVDPNRDKIDIENGPFTLYVKVQKKVDDFQGNPIVTDYYSKPVFVSSFSGIEILSPLENQEFYLGHIESGVYGINALARAMLWNDTTNEYDPIDFDQINWDAGVEGIATGDGEGLVRFRFIPDYDPTQDAGTPMVYTVKAEYGLDEISDSVSIKVYRPSFDFIGLNNGEEIEDNTFKPYITFEVKCAPQGVVKVEDITLNGVYHAESINGFEFNPGDVHDFTLGPGIHCAVFQSIPDWLPDMTNPDNLQNDREYTLIFSGEVGICNPDVDINCFSDDTDTRSFSDTFDFKVEHNYTNYSFTPTIPNIYYAEPQFDSPDDIFVPPYDPDNPPNDPDELPVIEPILTKMTDFPFEPGINYWDNHFEIYKILYRTTRDGELFTYRPEKDAFLSDEEHCTKLCEDNYPYSMQFRADYKYCTPMGHRKTTVHIDALKSSDFSFECDSCPDCSKKYAQLLDDPDEFPPGTYMFFPQSNDYWREYRQYIMQGGNDSQDDEDDQGCEGSDDPACYCYDMFDPKPDPTRLVYLYQIEFDPFMPRAFSPGRIWSGPLSDGRDPIQLTRLLPVKATLWPEFVSDRRGIKHPFILTDVDVSIEDNQGIEVWRMDDPITLIGGRSYHFDWDGKDEDGNYLSPSDGPITIIFSKETKKGNPGSIDPNDDIEVTLESKKKIDLLPHFDFPYAPKAGQTHINGVNVATGNLDWNYHLYTLQNNCMDLPFTLSANPWTLDDVSSPIGQNMWPQFDTRLQFITAKYEKPKEGEPTHANDHLYLQDQKFVFVKIAGLVNETFYPDEDDNFYPEPGREGSLTYTGESYEYRDKYGTLYTFTYDKDHDIWDLDSIEDLAENEITFEYDDTDDKHSLSKLSSIKTPNVNVDLVYDEDTPIYRLTDITMSGTNLQTGINETKQWTMTYVEDYLTSIQRPGETTVVLDIAESQFIFKDAKIANRALYNYKMPIIDTSYYDVRTVKYYDVSADSGQTTTYRTTYTIDESPTTVVLPGGPTQKFYYNEFGNVTQTELPGANQQTVTIHSEWEDMRLTSFTNGRTYKTSYEYDTNGNVLKETFTLNGVEKIRTARFNIISRPLKSTDANGNTQKYSYQTNKPANLEKVEYENIPEDGPQDNLEFDYFEDGRIEWIKNANGNSSKFQYDTNGFETHSEVGGKQKVKSEYDAFGNLTSREVKIETQTVTYRYTYDAMDRLKTVTLQSQQRTDPIEIAKYEYDNEGNVTEEYDGQGNKTTYVYDAFDRLEEKKVDNKTLVERELVDLVYTTKYQYDSRGNIEEVTNPKNIKTIHAYYDNNLLKSVTRAGVPTDYYEYDKNGNVTLHVGALPAYSTSYTYDELDQPNLTTFLDGTTRDEDYDAEGNLTKETLRTGLINEYEYDHALRIDLHRMTYNDTATNALKTVQKKFTYDPAGNLKIGPDFRGNETTYHYDTAERVARIVDAKGKEIKYSRDDQGNITEIIDQENRTNEFHYNDQGLMKEQSVKVTQGTIQVMAKTQYSYDNNGRLTKIIDPEEHATTYEYDSVGNTITVEDPKHFKQYFEYDALGNRIFYVDQRATRVAYTYDDFNRNLTVSIPADETDDDTADDTTDDNAFPGYSETYTYFEDGHLKSFKDSKEQLTTFTYDPVTRTQTTIDVNNEITTVEKYDVDGHLVYFEDKLQHVTEFTFDQRGLLVARKDPDPNQRGLTFAYDEEANLVTVIDKKNIIDRYVYDVLNRKTDHKRGPDEDNLQTMYTFGYDVDNLISVKDALNKVVEYNYNEQDLMTGIEIPAMNIKSDQYKYDLAGNRTEHVDPDNIQTKFGYDERNLQTSVTVVNPDDSTQNIKFAYEYDEVGKCTSEIPPKQNRSIFTYDRMNRPTTVSIPEQSTTKITYNRNGLKKTIDHDGELTSFTYNNLNQRESMTDDLDTTYYAYYENGTLWFKEKTDGSTTTYTYDLLDRKSSELFNSTAKNTTDHLIQTDYGYDDNDNLELVKMAYASGSFTTTEAEYDHFNRRKFHYDGDKRIDYTYYANGLVKTETVNGKTTKYIYDDANRLILATTPEGLVKYILSDAGKILTRINPDGSETEYEYDFAGRIINQPVKKKDGTTIRYDANTYDLNGNITLKTTRYNKTPDENKSFTYDDQDRLKTITEGPKTTTFLYDAQGNRTAVEVRENQVLVEHKLYHYDDQKRLALVEDMLDPTLNISFGYDTNGNMNLREQGVITETWEHSPRNQPLAYFRDDQLIETYTYNHMGMRVSKHNHIDDKTTYYFHDGHRIMEESDENGNPIRSYRYGTDLIGYEVGGLPQYTHTDQMGSIMAVTSASGEVLETTSYAPFGGSIVIRTQGETALNDVRVFHPDAILPLFFNFVSKLEPGDPPTQGHLHVLSPDGVYVDQVWYPEIEMVINDDGDSATNEVTIPVTQVPLTMVSDLSPPFVELMVDQFYLTENGTLTYTVSPGIDNNTTLTNAQISVVLPPQIDLTTFDSDLSYDVNGHIITWVLNINSIPEHFQFWFDVTYADHDNTILTLQVELLADGGSIERVSNRIYTVFRTTGLAFFAIPYIGDGGPATAYALPASVPNYYTDFDCYILYFGEHSQNIRSFIGKIKDSSTGLLYFDARYYDAELGRFTAVDPVFGNIYDPRTFNQYAYGFNNPYVYIDENGESATGVGIFLGYFWGFGQMSLSMARDLMGKGYHSWDEYIGIWLQNIVGGAEIGASFDLTWFTGGMALYMGSGALGFAGFDALTFTGEGADSFQSFIEEQATSMAIGAVAGPVLAKGAPYVGKFLQWELTQILGEKAALDLVIFAERNAHKSGQFVYRYAQTLDAAVMEQFSRKAIERTASRFFPKPPTPRFRFNLNNPESPASFRPLLSQATKSLDDFSGGIFAGPAPGPNPNKLLLQAVNPKIGPTAGGQGVYIKPHFGKTKTGMATNFRTRYNLKNPEGGASIQFEIQQSRIRPPKGLAAIEKKYWKARYQRRFDEEYIDRLIPPIQRYRSATVDSPVSQLKWEKYRHIFGYSDLPPNFGL